MCFLLRLIAPFKGVFMKSKPLYVRMPCRLKRFACLKRLAALSEWAPYIKPALSSRSVEFVEMRVRPWHTENAFFTTFYLRLPANASGRGAA
jgi:hypothetical protein